MRIFKKTNPRRTKLRKEITAERLSKISRLANKDIIISVLLWVIFVIACVFILSFELLNQARYRTLIPVAVITAMISFAASLYILNYRVRIVKKHIRAVALSGLFVLLLATAKLGMLLTGQSCWTVATAVTAAIILTIAYDQRFAMGMSMFYCLLAVLAAGFKSDISLLLIMIAAVFTCCISLREIRTRMKLLEVGALTATVVFITSVSLDFLAAKSPVTAIFKNAGYHAFGIILVVLLIQGLMPLIEKVFRIATSMTLLDYSDANQPLLKRLAMEAPGTFSHSLLVGSIAEAAAEAIGCNGLLCRVGAYYHDIGKMNKPSYFIENQTGPASKHEELSPAMSQLVIVGHVKDGVEMAKEYKLPVILRQFIETHHGTTLVEYFYNQAKKKQDYKQAPPSDVEFRYTGPRPQTKEAAIVMLTDAAESAARALPETTPVKIDTTVHNIAIKRLQDGQFDQCELTLRELSQIEKSISKALAAYYHNRITYPSDENEDRAENNSADSSKPSQTDRQEQTSKEQNKPENNSSHEI